MMCPRPKVMLYLDHIPMFYVKALLRFPHSSISHRYSVLVQCCSTLHQAVTSQAEDNINSKGVFIVLITEYISKSNVFRMN